MHTPSSDLTIMDVAGGRQQSTTTVLSEGESNGSLSICGCIEDGALLEYPVCMKMVWIHFFLNSSWTYRIRLHYR